MECAGKEATAHISTEEEEASNLTSLSTCVSHFGEGKRANSEAIISASLAHHLFGGRETTSDVAAPTPKDSGFCILPRLHLLFFLIRGEDPIPCIKVTS